MNKPGRLVLILILGGFGIVAPLAIVSGMTLFRARRNAENEWFRAQGKIESARLIEIVTQPAGEAFAHVAVYEVSRADMGDRPDAPDAPQTQTFREPVDGLAWETWQPGQALSVWLAGDRARIVRADEPLRPKLYALLVIPATALLLLGIVVYWNRSAVATSKRPISESRPAKGGSRSR